MTQDPTSILESVIDLARKSGADAVEAIYQAGHATSVSCRNGELDQVQNSESSRLSIRVFVGRRPASASTSDLDREAVATLVARAITVAKLAPEDAFADLTPHEELAEEPALDLQTFDGSVLAAIELKELALRTESAALAVNGVVHTQGAGATFSGSNFIFATSNGFIGEQSGSAFSIGCGAVAGVEGLRDSDSASSRAVFVEDMESPEVVGRRAGERAAARTGSKRMRTGRYPIVFDPRVSRTLLEHFAGAVSGSSIVSGSSFLKDRMGESIFPDGVEIIDDPFRVRSFGAHWFDGEGVATQQVHLVKNGVLQTWLLDRATARQLSLKTNGKARRNGAGTTPGISNFYMAPGLSTPAELCGDIEYGLYVTGAIGQGVNGVTGGYSRGATGFLIEHGEITTPVKEITMAGNLLDMFHSMTPANDLEFRYGVDAPTIRVDGMTIAGK